MTGGALSSSAYAISYRFTSPSSSSGTFSSTFHHVQYKHFQIYGCVYRTVNHTYLDGSRLEVRLDGNLSVE